MNEKEIVNKWFEENMCVSFDKFIENWEEQKEFTNYLQQENKQLKEEKNKLEQAFIELYKENQKLFNHLTIDKILKGDPNDKTNKENN